MGMAVIKNRSELMRFSPQKPKGVDAQSSLFGSDDIWSKGTMLHSYYTAHCFKSNTMSRHWGILWCGAIVIRLGRL